MPNNLYLGQRLSDFEMYKPHVSGSEGAVSSNSPYATQAGLDILARGGNAVDAAVAISLVLGAVEPHHSGIGGGCFSLLYHKASDRVYALDARGTAPGRAYQDMFLDERGDVDVGLTEFSGRAAAVPALYRALDSLLQRFGTMGWEKVSAPAIRLCREGFRCGFTYARVSDTPEAEHNRAAYEGFSDLYLNNGRPRVFGELVTNRDLADTMEAVARNGVDWFYQGPMADDIVRQIQRYEGLMDREDLSNCRAVYRDPVGGSYRGYDVVSMPPPSSGGTHIIQALNILENFDLSGMGWHSAESTHVVAETMKLMFADRSVAMADPDFNAVQVERLISKAYGRELAEKIDAVRAQEFSSTLGIEAKEYRGCTSNFCVMDRYGNVLSQTQTIRNWWGCGVVIPRRGFVMNNAMADFSPKAGVRTTQGLAYGMANAVRPRKTPLSSMCPSLVFKNGEPFLALGAAGGPRIITSNLQTILNVVDYQMMMDTAVNSPHFCCLTMDQGMELEYGFSPDTIALLQGKGHKIVALSDLGEFFVMPNGIMKRDGIFFPAGAKRTDGGGGAITASGSASVEGICFP